MMDKLLYINGRFLAQPFSGVQRFAREMTVELGRVWPATLEPPVLLVPPGTNVRDAPIQTRVVGRRTGVAWEQRDLPRAVGEGFLLNLGNTGPLFLGKQQAVVLHDTGVFAVPEAYSWAFVAYYRLLHHWLLRSDTRVVTVSNSARADILRYIATPRNPIYLISEGSDHMRRVVADPAILAEHGLEPGRFVLAVGNLAVHKNLVALGETAQRLHRRGVELVITGQLDKSVFATRGVALPEPARYVGRISDGALKALYQAAGVFVFPSKYEGFGLPAGEAMACGCPVVASAIPALQEVCGDAAVYVDPRSPASIADGVERILDDPALVADLRRAGLARAALFRWDRGAMLFAAALLEAMGVTMPPAVDMREYKVAHG